MSEVFIEREKYYKNDYEGFAIFLVTRAYNDLQLNTSLFNRIDGSAREEAQIYFFKLLASHLKETLKVLGVIKKKDRFKGVMDKWRKNKLVNQIMDEIKDELENTSVYTDTVNAKYLDFRNEVFHYCNGEKDFVEYNKIQKQLEEQDINVIILQNDKNKYEHEIGVDIQISQGIFNEEALREVTDLKEKVQLLLKEILNDYFNNIEDKKFL